MRRTRTTLIGLVAGTALIAGCAAPGGTDGPTDPSSTPSEETTQATDEPTTDAPTTDAPTSEAPDDDADGPAFPADTAEQTSDQTAAALLLVDVRVAAHDGFDRLVLEFEGDGEPGWRVGYVDSASTQGKGDPITLEGDALLSVSALAAMPDDMAGFYDGPRQFEPDLGSIEEVFVDGTFEGETLVVLGIDDPDALFRVFTLTSPTRLVVDVEQNDD